MIGSYKLLIEFGMEVILFFNLPRIFIVLLDIMVCLVSGVRTQCCKFVYIYIYVFVTVLELTLWFHENLYMVINIFCLFYDVSLLYFPLRTSLYNIISFTSNESIHIYDLVTTSDWKKCKMELHLHAAAILCNFLYKKRIFKNINISIILCTKNVRNKKVMLTE